MIAKSPIAGLAKLPVPCPPTSAPFLPCTLAVEYCAIQLVGKHVSPTGAVKVLNVDVGPRAVLVEVRYPDLAGWVLEQTVNPADLNFLVVKAHSSLYPALRPFQG